MTNIEKDIILQSLEMLDDFVVGAVCDRGTARTKIETIKTIVRLEQSPSFDYKLMITSLCNAIRELADAYDDIPIYNDYINKAIRNTCDALHSLETVREMYNKREVFGNDD